MPHFTEPAGLCLWSQDYSTGSYTELDKTSPTPAVLFTYQDQYGNHKMIMMLMIMTTIAFGKQTVSNVAV
jgi:hypothetical protein